jgi:hypothetical protein
MFNCQRVSRRSNKHEAAGVYAQTQRATVNRITQHIVQASTAPSAQVKRFHAKNTRSVKINQPLTPGFHPNLTAQFNPTMTLKWFKRRFCTLFNMYDDFFFCQPQYNLFMTFMGGKKWLHEWCILMLVILRRGGRLTRKTATNIQHDVRNAVGDWLRSTTRPFATFLDLPAVTTFKIGCDLISNYVGTSSSSPSFCSPMQLGQTHHRIKRTDKKGFRGV